VRAALLAVFGSVVFLCQCGYVGPVVPPSPEIPVAIADLSAKQQGDKIVIAFSTPPRTTDSLPIKSFSEIDLRIGPRTSPFDLDRWSASAKPYPILPPQPNDPDDPRPQPIEKSIPVSDWQGQSVAVAVRTAIKSKDHYSQWSNVVRLRIVPPLQPPSIQLEATAQGVKVTWPAQGEGLHYEIYRQAAGSKQPVQVGTAEQNEYVDTTAQFGVPYQYSVAAIKDSAESLPSRTESITPKDIFPPSIPAAISGLATPVSIEVSWQRSPEPDLKGYYIYRSVDGGPFAKQGDLLTLPTYSDHNVEHGKTYKYQVTAIDQSNNESGKSATAEVSF